VLVPTRGRPDNIVALMKSWEATSSGIADLILSVDWDDPKRNEYPESIDLPSWAKVHYGPRRRLGGTLNKLAPVVADHYDVVGFMGDDHRPRTPTGTARSTSTPAPAESSTATTSCRGRTCRPPSSSTRAS
jgi:hypothetical protein